jgi:hypothetical protein
MCFLADTYYMLQDHLQDETSGVVSISALRTPKAVYLGWVGDCVGCVFDPVTFKLRTDTASVLDFAEHETTSVDRAQSIPHCFASEPVMLANRRLLRRRAKHHQDDDLTVERYETHSDQEICRFSDDASQNEYEKLQRAHPGTILKIDSTVMTVGDSPRMLVDARLARSVQPTRVLGDVREDVPLRHPTVMRVNDALGSVLLCSDGVLSRGAFADLEAVVACVGDPLAFVRASFYRRGQELTERLIACGHLSPSELGLYNIQTWSDFITFLRTRHLRQLRSRKLCSTFQEGHSAEDTWVRRCLMGDCPAHHLHWLCACETSVQWFESHQQQPLSGANVVAHMAVVMGSLDNVTVLLLA